MLSRVAESIYWMARYIERAENTARFVDVNIRFNLDHVLDGRDQWQPLVQITGDDDFFSRHYRHSDRSDVIRFLTFDEDYPSSVVASLQRARENARTVREALPSEVWEQINNFYHFVRDRRPSVDSLEGLSDFFTQVMHHSHLYSGILDTTMSRGDGWHFANLGRMLERADKTSRLLDVKYFTLMPLVSDINTTVDDLHWSALLRSVSGFEMYRKQFRAITVHRVTEFLIRDTAFPRAILFCLNAALESLRAILPPPPRPMSEAVHQELAVLQHEISMLHVPTMLNTGMHEFVDELQQRLNRIDTAIYKSFFDRTYLDRTMQQTQIQFGQ